MPAGCLESAAACASEVNDDLALAVAVPQVLDGFGGLAQWVGPVDDGPDLAGLDEFGERLQVLRVLRADKRGQRLAGERESIRARS